MASSSYSTPTKKAKMDSITGIVKNCSPYIIKSPSKTNSTRSTDWFEFCLVSKNEKRRAVSFCSQHHVPISSVSGSTTKGIKISNIDISGVDITLQASSLIEIVDATEDKYKGPTKNPTSIENVLLQAPMNSVVTVVGKVVDIHQYSTAKCTVHKLTVSDETNRVIIITSFSEMAATQGRRYRFEDVEVSEYRNNRQLSFGVKSELIVINDEGSDGDDQAPEEEEEEVYSKVTIVSMTPGSTQRTCEECNHPFLDSPDIYVCNQCNHISRTCVENATLGEMTILDEQRLRVILKFQNKMLAQLFDENTLDNDFPKEKYLEVMKTSFKIKARGGHATTMEKL